MSKTANNSKLGAFEEFGLIFIVSGGAGTSGELVTRTVLAQFDPVNVSVQVFPKVFTEERLAEIFADAQEKNALIVHSFVDPQLREAAIRMASQNRQNAIDVIGPLMDHLANQLGKRPLGKPGFYRELHKSYFDRVEAIDFTIAHDDGKDPEGWPEAEIVLVGPSRVGKTPLSLYLSILGWRVANVPLIPEVQPHPILMQLDPNRVVGLIITPTELVEHRVHRMRQLGISTVNNAAYVDIKQVYEELTEIERVIRKQRFSLVDVTSKPIESSAEEVIRAVKRRIR